MVSDLVCWGSRRDLTLVNQGPVTAPSPKTPCLGDGVFSVRDQMTHRSVGGLPRHKGMSAHVRVSA